MRYLLSCIVLVLITIPTHANATVKYRLGASLTEYTVASGVVDLNANSQSNNDVVYIYSTTPTTESIPAISVSGTSSANTVRVLVAESGESFPAQFNDFVSRGSVDFGGLTFSSATTRDKSRVVVSASGDITGPITAGQIFRIDAAGSITSGGDITATADDGIAGFNACEFVTCGGTLLGDVKAVYPGTGDPESNINIIDCPASNIGPSPGTTGPAIVGQLINQVRALRINAEIVSSAVISRIRADSGGLHGSVTSVDGLFDLAEVDPMDGTPLLIVGNSTAEIHTTTIMGNLDLDGFSSDSGTAGIYGNEFWGNIDSTGRIDHLEFNSINYHTDPFLVNETEHITVTASGGIGRFVVNGRVGSAGYRDDLVEVGVRITSPLIEHFEVAGDFQGTITARVTECTIGGSLRPMLHPGLATTVGNLSLSRVQQLDIGGHARTYLINLSQEASDPPVLVRIGGSLGVDNVDFDPHFHISPSLKGQVVVNARNTLSSGAAWQSAGGGITVGDISGTSTLVPQYSTLPSGVGMDGGAAGEVPFRVHTAQSDFLNNHTGPEEYPSPLVITRWNTAEPMCEYNVQTARVEFYGPVALLASNPNGFGPVSVVYKAWVDADNDNVPDEDPLYWEVSHRLNFAVESEFTRVLRIKPKEGFSFFPGEYVVRSWASTEDKRLVCHPDALLTEATVPVAPFEYTFLVFSDCDPLNCAADNSSDPYQLGVCGTAVPNFLCDDIDFNGDSLFPDTQDLDDFLTVFSGGTCPTGTCHDIDFNNDGLFPDTMDQDALLSVFSGGWCLLP